MKYTGLRLASYLSEERGRYARLADAMVKYRGDRKNASDKKYNLAPLLHDGHNITIKILDGLMKETGKPLDFFIDFEDSSEFIEKEPVSQVQRTEIQHLREVIELKDELQRAKDSTIASMSSEIEQLKKLLLIAEGRTQLGLNDNIITKCKS
jgi:hypothetical protein